MTAARAAMKPSGGSTTERPASSVSEMTKTDDPIIFTGMVLTHPLKGTGIVTRVDDARVSITFPRCDADNGNPGIVRSVVAASRFHDSSGMDVIMPLNELLNDESWTPGPPVEVLLEMPSQITNASFGYRASDVEDLRLSLARLVMSAGETDDTVELCAALAELVDITTLLSLCTNGEEDLLVWAARVTQIHKSSNLTKITATWHQYVLPGQPDQSFELAMTLLSDISRLHSLAHNLDVAQSVNFILGAAEKRIQALTPEIHKVHDDLLSKVQKKHPRRSRR